MVVVPAVVLVVDGGRVVVVVPDGGRVVVVVLGGGATGNGRVVVTELGRVVEVVDRGRVLPVAPPAVAVVPAIVVSTPGATVVATVPGCVVTASPPVESIPSPATGIAPPGSQSRSTSRDASPSTLTIDTSTYEASPGDRWSLITSH